MSRSLAALALLLLSTDVLQAADRSAVSVAALVNEAAPPTESLSAALASSDALTRATAARVALVRDAAALLPALRETAARETDATAAREELRALALVGPDADVDLAIAAAAKWPSSIDGAVADAIARRGDALDLYSTKVGKLRHHQASSYFRMALWRHPDRGALTGSGLLRHHDEDGWRGLLDVLREANVAMSGGVLAASLDDPSEEIRTATVWYLVRGYAADPSLIGGVVRDALGRPREIASDREAFARELLRRMFGAERKDDRRWLQWLKSDEANRTFGTNEPFELYDWFTDAEYEARRDECGRLPHECSLPPRRPSASSRTLASTAVAPAIFTLPDLLPAGLADVILGSARCSDEWLGLATATVDDAGRVRQLDLERTPMPGGCKKALRTMLALMLTTNTSIRSPHSSDQILLVHAAGAPLCLDEDPPSESAVEGLQKVGQSIDPPKVIRRVEPKFPRASVEALRRNGKSNVIVILETTITKNGCVRNVWPLTQSPLPELNGAALLAISQWRFSPALLDGKPVDVIFELTIIFRVP